MQTPPHKHVDWAQRYRDENTPWDRGHAHGELAARLARGELQPPTPGARAYVPGCGRGYDAVALAEAGWRVTAVDIVGDLEQLLRSQLEPLGGEFLMGDATVAPREDFELVWEHTFLCALRPDQREAWAHMVRTALVPGGRFAALIFPADKPVSEGGPPWGYDAERLQGWLGDELELLESAPVDPALEARNWAQAYALFHRR